MIKLHFKCNEEILARTVIGCVLIVLYVIAAAAFLWE